MTTGFLHDKAFLSHNPGKWHPESPMRLTSTLAYLTQLSWFGGLRQVKAEPIHEEWLLTTHTSEYIRRAAEACSNGQAYLDTPDVGISPDSYDSALLAAGSGLILADALMRGEIRNGFALLRPPGHHAESSFAMGFCLFNNIAILARYLQKKHLLERICIIDWDVHHGNGTQHTFEEDPSVLFVSLHQYPFYPGTGGPYETGRGKGEGATLNCPMYAGAADADYEEAFLEKILPKLGEFKPDAILISAGFDAHFSDPLANINLSTEFYGWMTERLLETADKYSGGRIISLLEGGYDLNYLPRCVALHLSKLSGQTAPKENDKL